MGIFGRHVSITVILLIISLTLKLIIIYVILIHDLSLYYMHDDDDVVLHHTLPIFTGLGQCPIVNWDFSGAVSIFGPDALPVIHQ